MVMELFGSFVRIIIMWCAGVLLDASHTSAGLSTFATRG